MPEIIRNYTTVNINNFSALAKQHLFVQFLKQHDIDIAFLQEVNIDSLHHLAPYKYRVNVGLDSRGTAIVYRPQIGLLEFDEHPSGRIISTILDDTVFINVYAPSGAKNRLERERLYQQDLTQHMMKRRKIILLGDHNATIAIKDSVGKMNMCKALKQLVESMNLVDMWEAKYGDKVAFTFVRNASASRLDRAYVHKSQRGDIHSIKVIPVAFSDHHALVFQLKASDSLPRYGPGFWHLNSELLDKQDILQEFQVKWAGLKPSFQKANNKTLWWHTRGKPAIKNFFRSWAWKVATEKRQVLNFYFTALNDYHERQKQGFDVSVQMREVKTIICELQRKMLQGCAVRAKIKSLGDEEKHSFYMLARERRNEGTRFLTMIRSDQGVVTEVKEIVAVGELYYKNRFEFVKPIPQDNIRSYLRNVPQVIKGEHSRQLSVRMTEKEIYEVIQDTKSNTAPGPDGLPYEFYRRLWGVIKSELLEIFTEILESNTDIGPFADGIIIHIPKRTSPRSFDDLRPITLLNTDYKLFNKVLARRLKEVLPFTIMSGQSAAVPGRTILHTVSAIRDIILYYENNPEEKAALLSLDLRRAFDQVHHDFLWETMRALGMPEQFIATLRKLYSRAQSRLLINGYLSRPVNIRTSVRQGCPMAMLLFVVSTEPLLRALGKSLSGLKIGSESFRVRAFADDITALVTTEDEESLVQKEQHEYGRVSGAEINMLKSSVLPLGNWLDTTANKWLPRVGRIKILGILFMRSFEEMCVANWNMVLNKVRQALWVQTARALDVFQRVEFVNMFALSKVWYIAQILPTSKLMYKKFELLIGFFVWNGYVYRVARDQLRLPFDQGGLRLIDVEQKCKALLTKNTLCALAGSGDNFDKCFLTRCVTVATGGQRCRKVHKLLRPTFGIINCLPVDEVKDGVYLKTGNIYKRLVEAVSVKVAIQVKYPSLDWKNIWSFFASRNVPSAWKASAYAVVNEIVPTAEKRKRHGFASSEVCPLCQHTDTLEHRITRCGEAEVSWKWAMTTIQKITSRRETFPVAEILKLEIREPSRKRRIAVVWFLMGVLHWTLTEGRSRSGTLCELQRYIRQQRWRLFNVKGTREFGSYLCLI